MDTAAIDLQHQFYDMLMQSQYWPPERMRDYQRSELEQLLHHARTNVPFYEHRLDKVVGSGGAIDWERWEEIPIVKRRDLIEHRQAMQANVLPPGHGPVGSIRTSGSTGLSVEVTVTRLARLASDASRWRANGWAGLVFSEAMCIRHGEDQRLQPPNGERAGPWGPLWLSRNELGASFRMGQFWSAADQLDFVRRAGAPYLAIGGGGVAHILAMEAERSGARDVSIEFILTNGEQSSLQTRNLCTRVFGATIVDLYSSKEGAHMAHPCPHGSGYHVNAERVLIELVDDHGQQVPPGAVGRVVVTPFHSTGQPLIRYDQGDLARWGACSCGRTLPLLATIDGRADHQFRHPDGRRWHRSFPQENAGILKALIWQLAQVGPIDFEIRYVPLTDDVGDEEHVAAAFRDWYFPEAKVRFKRLEQIELTRAGKYMEYVYEA